jgi:hypothetical protein
MWFWPVNEMIELAVCVCVCVCVGGWVGVCGCVCGWVGVYIYIHFNFTYPWNVFAYPRGYAYRRLSTTVFAVYHPYTSTSPHTFRALFLFSFGLHSCYGVEWQHKASWNSCGQSRSVAQFLNKEYFWSAWVKSRHTSFETASFPAEIRIPQLPDV